MVMWGMRRTRRTEVCNYGKVEVGQKRRDPGEWREEEGEGEGERKREGGREKHKVRY